MLNMASSSSSIPLPPSISTQSQSLPSITELFARSDPPVERPLSEKAKGKRKSDEHKKALPRKRKAPITVDDTGEEEEDVSDFDVDIGWKFVIHGAKTGTGCNLPPSATKLSAESSERRCQSLMDGQFKKAIQKGPAADERGQLLDVAITATCPIRGVKKQTALIDAVDTEIYSTDSFLPIYVYLKTYRRQMAKSDGRIVVEVVLTYNKPEAPTVKVNKGSASYKAQNTRPGTAVYRKNEQGSTVYNIAAANLYTECKRDDGKFCWRERRQNHHELTQQMFYVWGKAIDDDEEGVDIHNPPQKVRDWITHNEDQKKSQSQSTPRGSQVRAPSSTPSAPVYNINYWSSPSPSRESVKTPIFSSPISVSSEYKYPDDALSVYFDQLVDSVHSERWKDDYRAAYSKVDAARVTIRQLSDPRKKFGVEWLVQKGIPEGLAVEIKDRVKDWKRKGVIARKEMVNVEEESRVDAETQSRCAQKGESFWWWLGRLGFAVSDWPGVVIYTAKRALVS